jgi:hypothetical protein
VPQSDVYNHNPAAERAKDALNASRMFNPAHSSGEAAKKVNELRCGADLMKTTPDVERYPRYVHATLRCVYRIFNKYFMKDETFDIL